MIDQQEFPPGNDIIQKLEETISICSREYEGLVPQVGKFPPIGKDSINPPNIIQWKHTKEGMTHSKKRRKGDGGMTSTIGGVNGSIIDLTSGRVLSCSTSSNPGGMVGMVMIVTGKQEKKLKFTSCESRGDHEVNLGIKMIALVCKATRWKKYNKNTHKRIFRVINHDGSTFASYDQDEMKDFTLGDVIEIMNFPKGKVLKIVADLQETENEIESDDDYDNNPFN